MTPELLFEYIVAASSGIAVGIFFIGFSFAVMGTIFGASGGARRYGADDADEKGGPR